MRDGQTNKQTREDIATQSMDTGKLSFRNMSNPYLWMIWKYSEIYMKYMKLLREIDVPFALGTSLWKFTWRQNQCQKCTGLLLSIAMDLTWFTAIPRISCDSEQAGGAGAVQVADAKEKLLEVGNKADGMKASCLAAVLPVHATPLGIRWNKNLDKGGFFCAEEQVSFAWESMLKKTDSQRHVTHDWIAKDHIMIDKYVIWSEYEHNIPLLEFTRASSMTPLGYHRVGQFILCQLAVIKFNLKEGRKSNFLKLRRMGQRYNLPYTFLGIA